MDFSAVEMLFSSYKERSKRFHRNVASGHISIPARTHTMLGGSLVTTAWSVLRLRMEETPSRYGWKV
jgi:hypothetical protein